MRILFIAALLTLAGCYQKVDYKDIELGNLYCADKGGLAGIKEWANAQTTFRCVNDPQQSVWITEEVALKKLTLSGDKE